MITEDYCGFEVSKLLKEKGFEIDTNLDYWKIGEDGTKYFMSSIGAYTSDINNPYAFYRPENSYPCPTQAMAMKWLREVHNIDIWVEGWNRRYKGCIHSKQRGEEALFYEDSYEVACEEAIKYCLENLI